MDFKSLFGLGSNKTDKTVDNIEQYIDKNKLKEEIKEFLKSDNDDVVEKITSKLVEGLQKSFEQYVSSIESNTDDIDFGAFNVLEEQIKNLTPEIFRTSSRRELCKTIKQFVRNYPEVYNSIRLIASYIVYGSSDISIEEYKSYPLTLSSETPKEDLELAQKILSKFEKDSRIKEYMFKIAIDLIECQDAFLELIKNKEGKIVNVKYLPTETIEIELDRLGNPVRYIQILNLDEIPRFADNKDYSQLDYLKEHYGDFVKIERREDIDNPYVEIIFNKDEILHFNDGSRVGVSDNPLVSMIIMWKFLRMVEEALVIHRITRARRFMIFFLDITGKTKEKALYHIRNFTNKLKNIFSIDLSTSSLIGKNSIVKSALDLVIPITKDSATKVQTIPSDPSASKIEDLKFYLNRILTNLMTSWVFYPERTGKEDIQKEAMIRMVKIYQKHMSYTISRLYEKILTERGLKNMSVEVLFPNPDSEAEVKLTDVAVRRMMLISQLSAIVGTSLPVDYILEFVFKDFSTNEVRQLIEIIKETQRQSENQELGAIFGAKEQTDLILPDFTKVAELHNQTNDKSFEQSKNKSDILIQLFKIYFENFNKK
jgi:hypothetical protein